jgi:hypothetical protein
VSIEIKRKRDANGVTLDATCVCGAEVGTYIEHGASVPDVPGPFPGDIECEACGRGYNGSGQEIKPRGEFDPADAGESWDE